ncbi:MAG TPA: hypothetical protein VNT75_32865, partial [Symbiobacteriaceae bacterium]|nr:hypothetical protein [Symbiobacteriaceae bacterium]
MRRIRLLWLTVLVALLLPGLARAAPQRISPDEYRGRLSRAIVHVRMGRTAEARTEMGSTWEVTLPGGPVTVDLRPVHDLEPSEAATVLAEHIDALDAALDAPPQDMAAARQRLNKALATAEEQQKAENTMRDWFSRLLDRLFGGGQEPAADPATAPERSRPSWLTYVALGVGAAGIGVLSWNLWRTLAGNAAGSDVAVRTGRKGAHPDRPLTPDELWQLAADEAAA